MDKFDELKNYLFSIKKQIWLSFFVFLIAILGGFLFAGFYPTETAGYIEEVKKALSGLDHSTPFQTQMSIFGNNIQASLLIVFLGLFLGFFSVTFLLTNGFILGLLAKIMFDSGDALLFMAGIIPHGVIEIPCILFSAAIGFKIGFAIFNKIVNFLRRRNDEKLDVTLEVAKGLEFFVLVIIPLLFFASFIEAYTTPLFMSLVST